MNLREIGWEGLDWIHLANNWSQWMALFDNDNELLCSLESEEFFE
jgi:hypothetical protein